MRNTLLFDFSIDKEKNTINVKREFAAPRSIVWDAWTNPEILDLWWAPKPYKTITKSMEFKEGGTWFYGMVSPENECHWCRADYLKIIPQEFYSGLDAFCDAEGNINTVFPRTTWSVRFIDQGEVTLVEISNKFEKIEDLEQIIALGFKEGFTMALGNLDEYISAKFKLRLENKLDQNSRVCTYLNFPGNTEEAMLFYKKVFKTEFNGNGIQRFGDIPAEQNQPPVADALKNMVLHVELPILGNHVLMATDAPPEMGFTVKQGNNMYISLEPSSKEETDRIFNELSAGGTIEMPLADMFWGAYFGSFTDRYGINWMLNFVSRTS